MMARWFESQRIAFIAEMLHIYGFINREHLMRKFGISQPHEDGRLHGAYHGDGPDYGSTRVPCAGAAHIPV